MKKNFFLILAALLLSSMAFAATKKMSIDITADSLANKCHWENGKYYLNFQLDGNISVRVDTAYDAMGAVASQSGVYYTGTPGDWRVYQARRDSFWLEAANGALIDSVQLTYVAAKTGTWSTKRGSSLTAQDCLASDAVLATGGQSKVCVYMGNTTTATNGQMKITRFRIYYREQRPENWHMETFKGAENATGNDTYLTTATQSFKASEATGQKWTTFLGSVRNNLGNFDDNAAVVRQRKSTESTKEPGYIVSDSIDGGIDSLAFRWNSNGGESGNWNIAIMVNNDTIGKITDAAGAKQTAGNQLRLSKN